MPVTLPMTAFLRALPIGAPVVTPSNPFWVVIVPGISMVVPVRISYRPMPPPQAVGIQGIYAGFAADTIPVAVRVFSPENRYFQLSGGTYSVKDVRSALVVATGAARQGVDNEFDRLFYDATGLPVGIYDVIFTVTSDGVQTDARPVRLLIRPSPLPAS